MGSTYRAVSDPSVHFAYNVTAMMVGNLADLVFDGQSAITQRGGLRGAGCHYIGNRALRARRGRGAASAPTPATSATSWRWRRGWRRRLARARLRAVGASLAAGSGSARSDAYLETAIVADLPLPVDTHRHGCAG